MGTHPSLPSKDHKTGKSLLDIIRADQSHIMHEILGRYNNKLPFLFKVLSIRKALSIQAHPDKELAKQLYMKDPSNYPGRAPAYW